MKLALCTSILLSLVYHLSNTTINNCTKQINYKNDVLYYASDPNAGVIINDYNSETENNNTEMGTIGTGGPGFAFTSLSPSIYKELDYQSRFFRNMISNKPTNDAGICGFTAISMLLSYYDNYANASIIDSTYESGCVESNLSSTNDDFDNYESPGVNDIYINPYSYFRYLESNEYKIGHYIYDNSGEIIGMDDAYKQAYEDGTIAYINANIDTGSFLGKLFQIAINNNYYRPHEFTGEYLKGPGVSFSIMYSTISSYLDEIRSSVDLSLYADQITANTVQERTRIRSEIISLIQSGHPVIVGGNFTNDNSQVSDNNQIFGHAVVAYEYDEENDIIYCNLGYDRFGIIKNLANQHQSHANMDDFFNIAISDYYCIDIGENVIHSHSNKYRIAGSLTKICSCALDSHLHNYLYECYDVDKHYRQCYCSLIATLQNHVFYREVLLSGRYYSECLCGYLMLSGSGPVVGV